MYHALEDGQDTAAMDRARRPDPVYTVSESSFRHHLELVAGSGLPVAVPGAETGGEGDRIFITFDDGHESDRRIALPLLVERGMKAVFFITTGWTGSGGYMDAGMIRELAAAGMVVGSHGSSHAFLTGLGDEALADELSGSRKALEDITGARVDSLSAPGGRIDARVAGAAREAGYRWLFSSEPAVNGPLREGVPAGRFAVTGSRSPQWMRRVIGGSPPASELMRYRALGLLKSVLGDRLYASIRDRLAMSRQGTGRRE